MQIKGHSTMDHKSEWLQGVLDPGVFKLDHLESIITYFSKIYFHFTYKSHAEFPFHCMQRKGHSTMDSKSEWLHGPHEPGIFKLDHFESWKSIFYFHFTYKSHAAFQFHCTQRKGHSKLYPKSEWQVGCMPLSAVHFQPMPRFNRLVNARFDASV